MMKQGRHPHLLDVASIPRSPQKMCGHYTHRNHPWLLSRMADVFRAESSCLKESHPIATDPV
ncbi:hypothetical protein VFPPC_16915 [Pochonia chlamydosporia 170]|uniref:Uncharacterized protein n=1 Tax=Pochonia chlamydosporia 170 TaxID=1380566 RepID=A0A179F172_METCM|nr:hypothetical protein VFPPC_16915 [Pochonia chlamydosporia 170]OAQ59000.1 hypothetical protein VFPPC_16915 [Pochonia chlamydosporia 170]